MQKLNVKFPINSLGMGQVAMTFLKEFHRRQMDIALFPIGQPDISAYDDLTEDFKAWLQEAMNNRHKKFDKETPLVEFWHLNRASQAEHVFATRNFLLTNHETDQATPTELKICANYFDKVLFSSVYSRQVFNNYGATNADTFVTPYDDSILRARRRKASARYSFCLVGKWERRKQTDRVIRLWLEKFADDPEYSLTCLVDNPFVKSEDMNRIKQQAVMVRLDGSVRDAMPQNISFLPHLPRNSQVNDLLASHDYCLSLGTEGWGMPAFYSAALGNWPVVMNMAGQKDWADKDVAVLVNPSAMIPSEDGAFFRAGAEYNQGNFFNFSDEAFYQAIEEAKTKEFRKNNKDFLDKFSAKSCVENLFAKFV